MATKESLIADVMVAEVALARAKEALAAYRPKGWWIAYHAGGAPTNFRLTDCLSEGTDLTLFADGRIGHSGHIATGRSNVILFR